MSTGTGHKKHGKAIHCKQTFLLEMLEFADGCKGMLTPPRFEFHWGTSGTGKRDPLYSHWPKRKINSYNIVVHQGCICVQSTLIIPCIFQEQADSSQFSSLKILHFQGLILVLPAGFMSILWLSKLDMTQSVETFLIAIGPYSATNGPI